MTKPTTKPRKKSPVKRVLKRVGKAAGIAAGATSWAIGQAATGGEYGRMRNRHLDEKVRKELTTKGISKKKK